MDLQSRKAFLVGTITSSQEIINAIRADFKNPDYRAYASYEDECMAGDEIEFQKFNILTAMERLEL